MTKPCKIGKELPTNVSAYSVSGQHAPCPYFPEGHTDGHNKNRIRVGASLKDGRKTFYCNACGAWQVMEGQGSAIQKPRPLNVMAEPDHPRISQDLPRELWEGITEGARKYFNDRGISSRAVDAYLLGWNPKNRRYSVPCYDEKGQCWGIQYRASYAGQEPKYTSETGSFNRRLFNARVFSNGRLAYVLIVEGPLDAIALTDLGFPAIAKFDGNQAYHAWEVKWNKFLNALDRIIIPDNDDNGELIAISKLNDIANSRIHRLPEGVKDTGEFIKRDLAMAKVRVQEWLGLPPIL